MQRGRDPSEIRKHPPDQRMRVGMSGPEGEREWVAAGTMCEMRQGVRGPRAD